MRARSVAWISIAVSSTLAAAGPVGRAEPARPKPWSVEMSVGTLAGEGHFESGVSPPPPIYTAVSVARDLAPVLAVRGTAGLSLVLGPVIGAAADVFFDAGPVRWSLRVGPLLAPRAAFGLGVFAQADLAARLPINRLLFLSAGYAVAFGLRHAGSQACGIDTCDAWTQPGDRIDTLHAGFGLVF